MTDTSSLQAALAHHGLTRRDFLKFCSALTTLLALPGNAAAQIAASLWRKPKPPVVYLEFQDCAGCTESLLRSPSPTIAQIVLSDVSLNYHETIMAAAGKQAEEAKQQTIREGGYLLMVEGSVPVGTRAACCIGGRSAVDLLKEAAAKAAAIVSVGNCACFGNIPAADPNPTGAVGVWDVVSGVSIVNMAGCPPNPANLAALVAHFITFRDLPKMDNLNRPLFAYGGRIHDYCERRAHFDAGRYVEAWGDEGHRLGWCLYKMGCKGPATFHNCPSIRWNLATSWPVGAGHGCVGCSEIRFWDRMTPFYERLPEAAVIHTKVDLNSIAKWMAVASAAGVAGHAVGSSIRGKLRSRDERKKQQGETREK